MTPDTTHVTEALGRVERAERELRKAREALLAALRRPPNETHRGITDTLLDVLRQHYPEPISARAAWTEIAGHGVRSTSADPVQQLRVILKRLKERGEVETAGRGTGLWRLAQAPDKQQR
ncbi:MAG: hypothetical protein ACRDYD_02200 [Acidimicrobiales bacterium]